MPTYKVNRLSEDIKRELPEIMRKLKDPRIKGILSIVKLDLAKDLSSAKVYISSMDGFEAAKESVKGLSSAAGFIRRELAARVEMRRSPELKFIADNSIEYSAEISNILKDLKE